MYELLKFLNENIIWGTPMLGVLLFTGIFFTVKIRFKNFTGIAAIVKNTLFYHDKNEVNDKKMKRRKDEITPFQTLTAALGATLGTGNIVAVGAAVAIGGAGAIFWMWVSALLGMATCYAENYLGIKHRSSDSQGTFSYIEAACKSKTSAYIYAIFCVLASIGVGNMAQINAMSESLRLAFDLPPQLVGIVAAIVVAALIFGGIKRIGKVTEKIIPAISIFYIVVSLIIIFANFKQLPQCFSDIFTSAFNLKSAGCGILGSVFIRSMSWGFKRGVFSNEAGLGSSVMFHSSSTEDDPARQGQWAMLQVFIDTIVMCSLTALVLLVTGADKIAADGITNAIAGFSGILGSFSAPFIAIMLTFFALTTAAGWSVCGLKCFNYLTKNRGGTLYLLVYAAAVYVGACARLEVVWELADLFNGLMIIPNVYALLALGNEVVPFAKTVKKRKINVLQGQ